MSLLEALKAKSTHVESEKVAAEDIFANAFMDELVKMGCSEEMLKHAGLIDAIRNFASSPFRRGAKTTGRIPGQATSVRLNQTRAAGNLAKAKAMPKPVGDLVPSRVTRSAGPFDTPDNVKLFHRKDRSLKFMSGKK